VVRVNHLYGCIVKTLKPRALFLVLTQVILRLVSLKQLPQVVGQASYPPTSPLRFEQAMLNRLLYANFHHNIKTLSLKASSQLKSLHGKLGRCIPKYRARMHMQGLQIAVQEREECSSSSTHRAENSMMFPVAKCLNSLYRPALQ